MSALFTFKRTKGGRTHYVASVIPKTAVVDGFAEDPAKAKVFPEADAKALFAVLEADPKVYGRWAVMDADGREVAVFTHVTPTPKMADVGPAKVDLVGMVSKAPPPVTADRLLADEPDHSPFRELAELVPFDGRPEEKLGDVVTAAIGEIKALRESLDALTAPADPAATTDTPA